LDFWSEKFEFLPSWRIDLHAWAGLEPGGRWVTSLANKIIDKPFYKTKTHCPSNRALPFFKMNQEVIQQAINMLQEDLITLMMKINLRLVRNIAQNFHPHPQYL
jgi:hypothetical protein